ncbi:MAG: hypothetical protein MJ144_01200 [Clostridia bacterium]|nr:hypothetical protein [Clostridia bacterium]
MKRPGLLLTIALLMFTCAGTGICFSFATYAGSHVFNNSLQTSGVDVRIETTGGGLAGPGELVDYNPRVINLNADSFIRVRFDENLREVCGLEKGWIKRGNCYYYKTPLATGESRTVFSKIRIPESLTDEDSSYRIRATADAIQAKNFQPDFNSISPWGTIKVEQAKASEGNQVASVATRSSNPDFNCISPGTFECSTEDLFSNFENFQPGDTYSEMLNMRNNSGREVTIYFRTENRSTDLLEEMHLRISCCKSKVYEGSLSSGELKNFMKVATIENGQAAGLEFQISMPKSADNRYAMLKDNVTWIIAVKDADAETPGKESPKTGDNVLQIGLMALVAAGSLLGIITILGTGRRRGRR